MHSQAFNMVLEEKTEDLNKQLNIFKYVDLEKYGKLNYTNKHLEKSLSTMTAAFEYEKKHAIERIQDCKGKDKQIVGLKELIQHAMFHMLVDVQEMVDQL